MTTRMTLTELPLLRLVKLSLSDFVIENDGVKSLEEQIDMLFSGLGRIKDN